MSGGGILTTASRTTEGGTNVDKSIKYRIFFLLRFLSTPRIIKVTANLRSSGSDPPVGRFYHFFCHSDKYTLLGNFKISIYQINKTSIV